MSKVFLTILLAIAALGSACGSPDAYILHIVAEDGTGPMGKRPVSQAAVDTISVVIAPRSPNAFSPLMASNPEPGVQTSVAPTGEFVLSLGAGYIEENAFPEGTSFGIDVPLILEETMNADAVTDPFLRLFFYRRGEIIAEDNSKLLLWPFPVPGESDRIRVGCLEDKVAQCLNNDP